MRALFRATGLCFLILFFYPSQVFANTALCVANGGVCGTTCNNGSFDYGIACNNVRSICCMPLVAPTPSCDSQAKSLGYAGGACYGGGCETTDIFIGYCAGRNSCCAFTSGGGSGGGGGTRPTPTPIPTYNISGTVYLDDNRNWNKDTGEAIYAGARIALSGAGNATTTSNGSGNFSFNGYRAGNYALTITIPGGYVNTTPTRQNVTLGPSRAGINFGITHIYSITGNVFDDQNKDRLKDFNINATEPNITSGITITTTGGNLSVNSGAGTYSITNLFAGTYTVSYTSPMPAGYFEIYPLNGPPPQLRITVGPNCAQTVNLDFGSSCSNGSVQNANFAISNSIPWMQTYGLNMRLDEGFEDDIPTNPDYPAYASVADNANGSSNLVTPTPTPTPTSTPTPTPNFIIPPTPTPTFAPGVGASCNAAGHAGICHTRPSYACSTYFDPGYCSGASNVQCCVTTPVICNTPWGSGTCRNTYMSCNGTYHSGYCPGASDVQCCVP